MSIPVCPFCLTRHSFGVPPRCGNNPIPQPYIETYDAEPPIWLMTAGFSGHGKTFYLGSLALHIQNMAYLWKGATFGMTDGHTQTFLNKAIDYLINSEDAPDSTPMGTPEPLLIETNDVPNFGSHWLVLYDVAGQFFNNLGGVAALKNLKSLEAARNIWFFVDLDQVFFNDNLGENIDDLLNMYLTGMSELGWSLNGRNLIVVYTKGDKFIGFEYQEDQQSPPYLPKQICNYYFNDELSNLIHCRKDRGTRQEFKRLSQQFSMEKYLEDLKTQSKELKKYTAEEVPGGKNFIERTKKEGMGLEFCLVSSTGTDFKEGIRISDSRPHRVLDPLLWTLKLNLENRTKRIKIVIDPRIPQEKFQELNLKRLYDGLAGVETEIYTYYLGSCNPALVASQDPPNELPEYKNGLKLIGPILDDGDDHSSVLLITSNPVFDLDDFILEEWRNKLYFVSIADNHVQGWDGEKLVVRNEQDIELLLSEFKKL